MRRILIAVALLLLAGAAAGADSAYRFDGVGRIVVFADVHGAYPQLVSLLREAKVIDETLRWTGRDTHLVGLGDLLDRGPESRRAMDLLMRLETEARQAGGAVHVLLGNHEVMNMTGDLRYVSAAEYAAFAGPEDAALREQVWKDVVAQDPVAVRAEYDLAFPAGYFAHRAAFAPTGHYGKWLFSRPFLITINDTAFVHAGLPPMVSQLGLEGTNRDLHAQLSHYLQTWQGIETELNLVRPIGFQERADVVGAKGALEHSKALNELRNKELFSPTGPTWFRGQALCYPHAETENLGEALAKLAVKRVVAGHTVSPTGRVLNRFDERVILLDTGMLESVYKGTPSAYIFENGAWSVAYADRPGERLQPETSRRAVGPRPRGLDDDALEQWLTEAEVVSVEELNAGVTDPQRVTLRKDGVELRAVFSKSDGFEYEVAAYELDRMIGLDMVPVTVPRTIDRKRGILQFWVDGSVSLRVILEQQLQFSGWCDTAPQYKLMSVFDVLIHNTGRTQESALFTTEWMLVLIGHSRAFPTHGKAPVLLSKGGVQVPPSLAKRLAALDRGALQAQLGPYLNRKQIDGLLKRRDQLLSQGSVPAADRQAANP